MLFVEIVDLQQGCLTSSLPSSALFTRFRHLFAGFGDESCCFLSWAWAPPPRIISFFALGLGLITLIDSVNHLLQGNELLPAWMYSALKDDVMFVCWQSYACVSIIWVLTTLTAHAAQWENLNYCKLCWGVFELFGDCSKRQLVSLVHGPYH